MIKMILADDEPIITRGIQKLVDWNSLGIQVAGEYADGREALDGILKERPDIALLDIFMPRMTGIEVLREINSLGLPTRVIFISGFQDFQYAKDALRYGGGGLSAEAHSPGRADERGGKLSVDDSQG